MNPAYYTKVLFSGEGGKVMKKKTRIPGVVFSAFLFAAPVFAELPQGSLPYRAGDSEKVSIQKEAYNEAYWTYLSVLASGAAYNPEQGEEAKYLRDWGWDFSQQQAAEGKKSVYYIKAKSNTADGTPVYVIAFRGTAGEKDWKADLKTERVAYGGNTPAEAKRIAAAPLRAAESGDRTAAWPEEDAEETAAPRIKNRPMVHKGFNEYTDIALKYLLDSGNSGFLEQYRREKNARLILTGHSLGGAVATLAGQRLIDYGFDPERIQVITFGAPAVANKNFKQKYGDRLDLIRVTNTADPVPLVFQAVLHKYKQFGKEKRFKVSRMDASLSHFMNLYLDAGLRNYYEAYDTAKKQEVLKEWPDLLYKDKEKPFVLVSVAVNKEKRTPKTYDDVTRFMRNEYKALFPNYVVIQKKENLFEEMEKYHADYLLTVEFDAMGSRVDNSWFLTLDQVMKDREGNLVSAGTVGKRTSPEAGNILAAMGAVRLQKTALLQKLPWLQPQPEQIPGKFY